jgi:hypothetical protein
MACLGIEVPGRQASGSADVRTLLSVAMVPMRARLAAATDECQLTKGLGLPRSVVDHYHCVTALTASGEGDSRG